MKKFIVLMVIVGILFTVSTAYADTAVKKLGRGLSNVFFSPIEIGIGIRDIYRENGIAAATTWGVIDGFARFAGRAICGAYETATFVLPPYNAIITNPEFLLGK